MNDNFKLFGTDASTVAKVGKSKSPQSLAALMPSSEIAAKVGILTIGTALRTQRVVRRNAAA